MDYLNKKFMIFNINELSNINFTQVLETSSDTIRTSANGLKTFVKWEGDIPLCVDNLKTKEGPYTLEEMATILSSSDWLSQGDSQMPIIT